MDKVYIDKNESERIPVKLPSYGEIRLIIKDGQVVKYDTTESYVLDRK